jgi:hypothetical protein
MVMWSELNWLRIGPVTGLCEFTFLQEEPMMERGKRSILAQAAYIDMKEYRAMQMLEAV